MAVVVSSRQPLMFMQDDGCIMTEMFDGMAESAAAKRFRLLRLPGGHFVHQEAPEEFNAAVLAWVLQHQEPR